MFNSICIKDFDFGIFAETALYYDKVIMVVNERNLNNIFSVVHPSEFIPFLEENKDKIILKYFVVAPFVNTFFNNGQRILTFGSIDEDFTPDPYLEYLWEKGGLRSPDGTNVDISWARRLYRIIEHDFISHEITKKYSEELENEKNLIHYFESYLMKTHPNLLRKIPKNLELKMQIVEEQHYIKRYQLEHNLDIKVINPYDFLEKYFTTFSTMEVWANYSSDFIVNDASSILIEERFKSLFRNSMKNKEQIELFQKVTLNNRCIREVMNAKERSFKDFIFLYENSRKFKDWLGEIKSDKNLLQEYIISLTNNTWADKLPSKFVRFGIFTGTGLIIDSLGAAGVGTMLGTAISAVDTFLIDKMIKGWKPNHFIDNELKKFIFNN